MAEFCTNCGKKLSERASKIGAELCFDCKKTRYLSDTQQDVSPQAECPLSKLIVEVKTSKGEPVGQAQVTVLKGAKQVAQGLTEAKGEAKEGEYSTGKVLEAGSYTVKAKRKCYKPEEAEKTPVPLDENDEKKVELTLDPYEIKITAKQPSYTIVLDDDRNPKKPDHPILEFDITDGPPNHFFDVQLSRDSADGLTGGPGLPDAWKSYLEQEERLGKTLFSSCSEGQICELDGSGSSTYKMPLQWWQDLYDTPLNQFDKSDFHYRVLAMHEPQSQLCTTSSTDKVEVKKEYKTVLKIWLLTWNCELMAPSNGQLYDLIVEHYENYREIHGDKDIPELIVVGLQEAGKANGQFIAERLQEPTLVDYGFLRNIARGGYTKGICYQDLGVLVRSDVSDKATYLWQWKKKKLKACRTGGKGGLILPIKMKIDDQIGDFTLGFISAHLDAGGKQKNDIDMIIKKMENVAAKTGEFDAVFMMGDLNYRIAPAKGGILTKKTKNKELCKWLLDPAQRKKLLEQDLLKIKCPLVIGEDPKFEFSKPDPVFFPSYKINYRDGKKYKKNYKKRGRLTNNPSYRFFTGPQTIKGAMSTYCWKEGKKDPIKEDDPVIYNLKRGAFDIGWLDRIGWATKWTGVLSERAEGKVKVNMIEFIGRHDAVLSDHAAVLMKVEVIVQP